MIKDTFKIKGDVKLELVRDNVVIDTRYHNNLVVTAGKAYIASRIQGTTKNAISHVAIGTNSTTASLEQVALFAQSVIVTLDSPGVVSNNTVTFTASFPVGTAVAATEAGLFNAASGGDMLSRVTFPVINKQTSDSLVVTWTIAVQ